MNHQADCRPHSHGGVKYMYGTGVLEVEAIQRRGRTHTWDGSLPHKQVESGESAEEVRIGSGIDAVPDTDETTLSDLNAQLLSRHNRQ
jgi:hypothetical protein